MKITTCLTADQAYDATQSLKVHDELRRKAEEFEASEMQSISRAIDIAIRHGYFFVNLGPRYKHLADKIRQLGYAVEIATYPEHGPEFAPYSKYVAMRISWDKASKT